MHSTKLCLDHSYMLIAPLSPRPAPPSSVTIKTNHFCPLHLRWPRSKRRAGGCSETVHHPFVRVLHQRWLLYRRNCPCRVFPLIQPLLQQAQVSRPSSSLILAVVPLIQPLLRQAQVSRPSSSLILAVVPLIQPLLRQAQVSRPSSSLILVVVPLIQPLLQQAQVSRPSSSLIWFLSPLLQQAQVSKF